MNYNALLDELVTKLNDYFTDNSLSETFKAMRMPEKLADARKVFKEQVVFIHYSGSEYDAPKSLSVIQQGETIIISLYFNFTKLTDIDGGYSMMDHSIKCLLGYRPSGARSGLFISNSGDWTEEGINQGVINPFIEMSFSTMRQQSNNVNLGPSYGIINGSVEQPAIKSE